MDNTLILWWQPIEVWTCITDGNKEIIIFFEQETDILNQRNGGSGWVIFK